MARTPAQQNQLFAALRWVPVLIYFVVKYLVLGNEVTRNQWIGLITFVIFAELGLWAYQRQWRRRNPQAPDKDGTNQER